MKLQFEEKKNLLIFIHILLTFVEPLVVTVTPKIEQFLLIRRKLNLLDNDFTVFVALCYHNKILFSV